MAGGLKPPASIGGLRALRGSRRSVALLAIGLGVALVHGCVTRELFVSLAEANAALAMPPRIEVAYVRDMELSTPPPPAAPAPAVAAAPQAARVPRAKVPPPALKASEPAPTETADAEDTGGDTTGVGDSLAMGQPEPLGPPPSLPTSVPPSVPPRAPQAVAAAAAVAASAAAATAVAAVAPPVTGAASGAAPAAFEWPSSTRLSYLLTGNYRGEVNGSAQVEWVRAGSRYQVHLDLVVGPSGAPLITRRMSSDGDITEQGLAPRRYDQDTKVILQDRRRVTIQFEPGSVVLANGERRDSVPGVQDTASQFVQLTYVFSTRPDSLKVGDTVDIPLALPHKVDVWTYDVTDEEVLQAPFGPLPTIHLKPRRKAERRAGELSADIWFAPQLRYLPVRIRIEQDEGTYIDLMINRRPEIAGP